MGLLMTTETILVTGASGFIAKHIILKLLNAGYSVRGTLRTAHRGAEIIAAVTPHLTNAANLANLTFAEADLEQDKGWAEAMAGVAAVMHTASPFPIAQPKNADDLIRPAVDGTLRVLRAAQAAGITRVILTSSSVAIMGGALPPGKAAFDEADWSDLARPGSTAYEKSKTLAERAAWDYAQANGMALTTINPTLVVGPPLDDHYGSSVSLIARILRGKDPAVPRIGLPVVDVRDVAEAHLRALQTPASIGQRIIAAEASLWFQEIAQTIKQAYPGRKIATMNAPVLVLRLLALFDPEIRSILPALGQNPRVSNARARTLLRIEFTPARAAILATAKVLTDSGKFG